MKLYKCDACGKVLEQSIRMYARIFDKETKFVCVDLCSECFKGVHILAEQKIKKQKNT